MKRDSFDLLPHVMVAGGVFDAIGGVAFALAVGSDRLISDPATHPFFAAMIATFLFSLAYLQFATARNVHRYMVVIGAVTMSRVLFGLLFLGYLFVVDGFSTTLLPTAVMDLLWAAIYVGLLIGSKEVRLRDAFVPVRAAGGTDVTV